MKIEFSQPIFEKILTYEVFVKMRPVGGELFHASGRTDGRTDGRT